jgi:AcrR family transcriptional regulator
MTSAKQKRLTRPERAAQTRAAILASARKAFARLGYDGAGVRGIAEGAGVTAMMVNRYFGSKEKLFAEVVAVSMADPVILQPGHLASATMAHDLASALVGVTGSQTEPLEGFLLLFRSASSPTAARIAREQIAAIHLRTAEAAVRSPDHAAERAAIFLALVAGMQMMRQMIGLPALAKADPALLIALLTHPIEAIMGSATSCP